MMGDTALFYGSVIQLFGSAGLLSLLLIKFKMKRLFYSVSLASIAVAFASSLAILYEALSSGKAEYVYIASWPYVGFSVSFIIDALSGVMALLVSGLSLVIGIYSVYYMSEEYGFNRFFVFYTLFVASMMLVVTANNLLLLFIGWEGTGLCSYALISHWYRDEEDHYVGDIGRVVLGAPMYSSPSQSGLRAILFTRVPDILMLAGIFAILLYGGSLDYDSLMSGASGLLSRLHGEGILRVVMLFLFLGPLAKSAQFPFHEWLVTAMTGPTPVSALIHAATMVKAGVYFMLRITPLFSVGTKSLLLVGSPMAMGVMKDVHSMYLGLAVLGALTAFSLASMAIVAREAKLILAYSTASQLGYMFLGIGASVFSGIPGLVLFFVLMHLVAHAVFKAGLFLGAGMMIHEGRSRYIDEWPRLSPGMRVTLTYMWILILSLAGFPPLIGFWTKDSLLETVFSAGMLSLGLVGVFTVFLTAFYSSRLLLYNYKYNIGGGEIREPPFKVSWTYGLLAFLSVILGVLWPLTLTGIWRPLALSFHEIDVAIETPVLLRPALTLASLSLLAAGLLSSYYAYQGPIDTRSLAKKAEPLTGFLYDRWLLNSVFYAIAVRLVLPLSRLAYQYIENGLDKLYHDLLPLGTLRVSRLIDVIHNGDLRRYIVLFALGVLLVLLLMAGGIR